MSLKVIKLTKTFSHPACLKGGRFMGVDWVASHPSFKEAKYTYIEQHCKYYGRNKGKHSYRFLISTLWHSKYFWSNSLQCPIDSVTPRHQQISIIFFLISKKLNQKAKTVKVRVRPYLLFRVRNHFVIYLKQNPQVTPNYPLLG